jgi:hypothetical protein
LVRLRFLGKVLSVERASKLSEAQQGKESVPPTSLIEDASVTRDVGDGSKFRSFPASEPIAPRLGVDYPFPPHLEYVSLSVLRKLFQFDKDFCVYVGKQCLLCECHCVFCDGRHLCHGTRGYLRHASSFFGV